MDTVNLKKGKTFVLELKGLASAGFTWQYTVDNKDLVSIKVDYKLPEPLSPKNMGASANEIFTITALQKGEAVVHFKQVRNWEDKSIPPVNEKTVKLIIAE